MASLLIENRQAPGDIMMLTCAVRDLSLSAPGRYAISVNTSAMDIWKHNPYLSAGKQDRAQHIRVGYTAAVNGSNSRAGHFATGLTYELGEKLGIRIPPTQLRADIHLTDEEKAFGKQYGPYWLICAGGKTDFTAKIWDPVRWQAVVDALPDVHFLQVGAMGKNHLHTPLTGPNVTNLLGRTSIRNLLALSYGSEGAVCGVTALMHAQAAFNRPCVVVAGGREPWWWTWYNRTAWETNVTDPPPPGLVEHRFLHTIGQLPCCEKRGCWKAGVGEKSQNRNCTDLLRGPSQPQPRCLSLITPQMVVAAISAYRANRPTVPPVFPAGLRPPLFFDTAAPKPTTQPVLLTKHACSKRPTRKKRATGAENGPQTCEISSYKPPICPFEAYVDAKVADFLPICLIAGIRGGNPAGIRPLRAFLSANSDPRIFDFRWFCADLDPASNLWVRKTNWKALPGRSYEQAAALPYHQLLERVLSSPPISNQIICLLGPSAVPHTERWLIRALSDIRSGTDLLIRQSDGPDSTVYGTCVKAGAWLMRRSVLREAALTFDRLADLNVGTLRLKEVADGKDDRVDGGIVAAAAAAAGNV